MTTDEKDEFLSKLFDDTNKEPEYDSPEGEMDAPILVINLDEVNENARHQAEVITERLSNYYFDEKYLKTHPYIPAKISQEIESIRRLLKMISVNEKAQDSLIANITFNAGKSTLYQSLTSLQNSILAIQTKLDAAINSLEIIFRDMQAECEQTFEEKDKGTNNEDGSMTVRGSREFIKSLNEKLYGKPTTEEPAVTTDFPDELTEADIIATA